MFYRIRNIQIILQYVKSRGFQSGWVEPNGVECGVHIYNSLTKSKVPLVCKADRFLSWYSCGPTVYDTTHIGHASSYMRLDIIRRVLSHWFDLRPMVAMGVTDIDDKIIRRSKELNEDWNALARKYELDFFDQMKNLNLLPPNFVLRVTEHIPEIIKFIETVILQGHAYHAKDGCVYFNTQSLASYGKVTGAPVVKEEAVGTVRLNKADFALWKSSRPGEPYWDSPWSQGRPGWHIECSTMASKVFGKSLDIHTGGLDLAFPHHENEEAQSCAHHDVTQWVNYWIHTGHLLMNGMKMSKSMKNFIPMKTFLTDYTPDHLRMLCLLTHYRTSIDYKPDVMSKAVALVNKFNTLLTDARSYSKGTWNLGNVSSAILLKAMSTTEEQVKISLADDFNTVQSIVHLEDLAKLCNNMLHAPKPNGCAREVVAVARVADSIQNCLNGLGLFLDNKKDSQLEINSYVIDKTVSFRNEVRQLALLSSDKAARNGLLRSCDSLRSDLNAVNIIIKDTSKTESTWTEK